MPPLQPLPSTLILPSPPRLVLSDRAVATETAIQNSWAVGTRKVVQPIDGSPCSGFQAVNESFGGLPPPYKAAGVTELKMCFLFGDIGSKIPVMVACHHAFLNILDPPSRTISHMKHSCTTWSWCFIKATSREVIIGMVCCCE